MHTIQQTNPAHNFGPHKAAPITHGFHENESLPVGGGKNGFVLGSFRPLPTLNNTALSFGHICTL